MGCMYHELSYDLRYSDTQLHTHAIDLLLGSKVACLYHVQRENDIQRNLGHVYNTTIQRNLDIFYFQFPKLLTVHSLQHRIQMNSMNLLLELKVACLNTFNEFTTQIESGMPKYIQMNSMNLLPKLKVACLNTFK